MAQSTPPQTTSSYTSTAGDGLPRAHDTHDDNARCRLYLMTPPRLDDIATFAALLDQTLSAGDVAALQIRLKDCDDDTVRVVTNRVRPVAHAHEVAVILNDRPDLAQETACDGVHVGQTDTPFGDARALMGPQAFVGVTCHNSRHLAMEAAEAGADYVAFGAFFPSHSKNTQHQASLDLLAWWQQMMTTPCVAIGGITPENATPLVQAGADFLAVCHGVWSYPAGPAAAIRAFNSLFDGLCA